MSVRCLDTPEAVCKGCDTDREAAREQEAAGTTFDLGFSPGGSAGAAGLHVILRLEAETAAETRVRIDAPSRTSCAVIHYLRACRSPSAVAANVWVVHSCPLLCVAAAHGGLALRNTLRVLHADRRARHEDSKDPPELVQPTRANSQLRVLRCLSHLFPSNAAVPRHAEREKMPFLRRLWQQCAAPVC
jgi:hypothetical protein